MGRLLSWVASDQKERRAGQADDASPIIAVLGGGVNGAAGSLAHGQAARGAKKAELPRRVCLRRLSAC